MAITIVPEEKCVLLTQDRECEQWSEGKNDMHCSSLIGGASRCCRCWCYLCSGRLHFESVQILFLFWLLSFVEIHSRVLVYAFPQVRSVLTLLEDLYLIVFSKEVTKVSNQKQKASIENIFFKKYAFILHHKSMSYERPVYSVLYV